MSAAAYLPPEAPHPRLAGLDAVVDRIGHQHPDVNGGWLRASVFGAMDGLISNCALIAGMVGGISGADHTAVVLAGIGGLAGGALSMAVGEYNSVASQSEFVQAEVAKERAEILANPLGETAELASLYVQKGVDPDTAAAMAQQVHRDLDHAVAVHAMEEFGVHPSEVPSPWVAATSSFVSFTLGAAVPLAPYLFGVHSLWWAVVMTLTALFVCGAIVARVTVRSWWWSGLRQMLLGGAAAAVTYLFGSLVGAGLG